MKPTTALFCGVALTVIASPAMAQQVTASQEKQDAGDLSRHQPAGTPYDDEIVVTAQKRSQLLMEVPQSISVIGGDRLSQQQATSFADYAKLVPSMTLQETNPGKSRIVLRGINTGGSSPTVSVYVDDVPYGASTGQSNGSVLAGDFDTLDIERVEVLRGPQGTLYGANSLGGLVKYVTTPPQLGVVEGKAKAGVETVDDGGTGWSGSAVLNVPLGDVIAVRAAGFYRKTPGFIDVVGLAQDDANDVESYGGRISVLFQPSEGFSIRLNAMLQNIRADSQQSYDADPRTLEPVSTNPYTGDPVSGYTRGARYREYGDTDYRLYSGALDWDLGFATLTSVTSYSTLKSDDVQDISDQLGGLGDLIYGSGGAGPESAGIYYPNDVSQNKFTQEVRLSSPNSDSFEWLIGGYYTKENGHIFQQYLPFAIPGGAAIDPAMTLPVGPGGSNVNFPDFLVARLDSQYREYAGFANATWHVTDRFDLTGGVRYSHNKQSTYQLLSGSLLPLSGGVSPDIAEGGSDENVFTWSVSPRFEISDHASIYARVAKGYRPGGPNVVPPGAGPDFPSQYNADTLVSYEAGVRAETADRTFAIDASLYYLDWKDIQVTVTYQVPGIGTVTGDGNGRKAISKGAEITATMRPIVGLDVIASVAYNDAKLDGDLPGIDIGVGSLVPPGYDGDRLPYAPEWTANVGADYQWALPGGADAFVGGNVHLISDQATDFDPTYRMELGRRQVIDGYATVDLHAGVDFDPVRFTVFVHNLNNSGGLVNVGPYGARPGEAVSVTPIRPRTFGATVEFGF
ncbi:TonB-dependent receptor [Stakelama sp. CBK3Z-3]|uniref:TonB-dependent receptor n=1 Tax=Stakelama flava TaxID=2860338 RepID=A0ABS6XPK6_9SPHN|nr:TonB-dependent receptor [Stakelama flava]MBW4332153.1 TonB-dependent receptor [Stakelama flava]